MNEIIHVYDTLSVVFKVILRRKLLGSVILKLRNLYLRQEKRSMFSAKLCGVSLSEVLYI